MISRFDSLGLQQLSAAERIELIEQIWDSMEDAELSESLAGTLTDTQSAELDQRIAEADAHPDQVIPWLELHDRLRGEQ